MDSARRKILIVEDDKFLDKAYKIRLSQIGFGVSIAQDGEKGFELAKKEMPDLIILDLMLPKMNGFEFLEAVKKDEQLKNIPVIVLSVLGQESDKEKAFALGAAEYLVKTEHTLEEIIKSINQHFK